MMGLGIRLQARYRSKNLPEIVEAQTKMGLGVAGVTVKCDGIAMKQLDGGDMHAAHDPLSSSQRCLVWMKEEHIGKRNGSTSRLLAKPAKQSWHTNQTTRIHFAHHNPKECRYCQSTLANACQIRSKYVALFHWLVHAIPETMPNPPH
ncbi:Uncharacterized protein TCM_005411 [Theobroma cacao]|uniref:Uncharacterized protein n=1 Tax=Theobroma cacao TaxID=3641 RepID=A0A061E1C4_THECC|nr:Uncharacterized protein TCM_005411 [Theobroma cacao]